MSNAQSPLDRYKADLKSIVNFDKDTDTFCTGMEVQLAQDLLTALEGLDAIQSGDISLGGKKGSTKDLRFIANDTLNKICKKAGG